MDLGGQQQADGGESGTGHHQDLLRAAAGLRTRLVSWDARKTETGMGRKATSGPQRRVALDVLEELGQEEEHAVHAGVDEPPGPVGRRPGGVSEEAERQDRLVGPTLVTHEHAEQATPATRAADGHRARSIPLVAGLDQPEDEGASCRAVEVMAPGTSKRP